MHKRQQSVGLWPGLILVAIGGGLLAREFGFIPPRIRLVDFWPLVVVFFGISGLLHRRGFWGALFSLALTAMGGVLLAGNLGFLAFPAARLWPALLVILGIAFLIRGARAPRAPVPPPDEPPAPGGAPGPESSWAPHRHGHAHGHGYHHHTQATGDDRLSKQYTFSGANVRIESQAWKGGELGVTAGGVELDLRNARLDPEGALLDVRVLMGGVELRVPDTWLVICEVTPFLGGAEDETRPPQGVSNAPRLRIVGTATLGGLNIRN